MNILIFEIHIYKITTIRLKYYLESIYSRYYKIVSIIHTHQIFYFQQFFSHFIIFKRRLFIENQKFQNIDFKKDRNIYFEKIYHFLSRTFFKNFYHLISKN